MSDRRTEREERDRDRAEPLTRAELKAKRGMRWTVMVRFVDSSVVEYEVRQYDYDASLLTLYLSDGGIQIVSWANVCEARIQER